MKKIFIILCAALSMTACMNDFDNEPVSTDIFTAAYVGEPNTTIAQVRTLYSRAIASGSTSELGRVNDDLILEGIVVANDISGNIYQAIYIQDVNTDGTIDTQRGGIKVAIKGIGSLAAVFPVGQKIRINLRNLYVSSYGQLPTIGMAYVKTTGKLGHGPMTPEYVKTNIQKIGTPYNNMVAARELTTADLKTAGAIDNLTPMLVVMHGCTNLAADTLHSVKYAEVEYGTSKDDSYSVEHTIQLADGGLMTLYTSTSAKFAMEVMPEGKLTMYGILSRYNNNWQFTLRSLDDVIVEK